VVLALTAVVIAALYFSACLLATLLAQ